MSVSQSRIKSIASIAIDTSLTKVDAANPILYGRVNLNKVVGDPDNYFNCNVPSTFNSAVSIIDTLNVYGDVLFERDVTIKSTLHVSGRSLLNGSSTISSDLYVSGNAYFSSSSIGSYLQISVFDITMGSNYYTKITSNNLLDNKLAVSDYNSTMGNHFYTQITTNTLLDNKLTISQDETSFKIKLPFLEITRKITKVKK